MLERLLEATQECDANHMIREDIKGSAYGHIYDRMIRFRDNPADRFVHGVYDSDPDNID